MERVTDTVAKGGVKYIRGGLGGREGAKVVEELSETMRLRRSLLIT